MCHWLEHVACLVESHRAFQIVGVLHFERVHVVVSV